MNDTTQTGRRALLFAALASPAIAAAMTASSAQAAADGGLTVIAEIAAKPEHADDIRAALTSVATNTRSEAGCLHYALYEDATAPGQFFTFERWTDEAALTAHLTSPTMKDALPKFLPLLAAAPAIHKLKPLNV